MQFNKQVFILKVHQKLDFDEIAVKLKTSKYSAKRAWGQLEHLFALRRYERYVSDYTGEVIDALPDIEACRLIKQVNNLSVNNVPFTEIAKQAKLFPYTVLAIQIRIEQIKEAQSKIDRFKTQFAQYPNTKLIIAELDGVKNCFDHFYNTGTKLMYIHKIERDLDELKYSRKKLYDLFISKLIQPQN